MVRKTLDCEATGKSYSRVVARCRLPDGRSLSCAAIASCAAVHWDRYWRQYRMGEFGDQVASGSQLVADFERVVT